MNEKRGGIDGGLLVGGVVLIGAGVVLLLDRVEVPRIGTLISDYWPMAVVAFGLAKLFDPRTMWSGLCLVSFGAWLQAVRLEWHGLTYHNSWPLLLMAIGGCIVLRTVVDPFMRRFDGEGNGSQQ